MEITSKEFKNSQEIPARFTADGENINPELLITNIPKKAKSLVLIVEDPDAKRVCGHTWIHWIQYNIKVQGEELTIKEDSIPGSPGDSTYHLENYKGPNPPAGSGIHNYHFKIIAISEEIEIEPMAKLNTILNKIKEITLDKAQLVGTYTRG